MSSIAKNVIHYNRVQGITALDPISGIAITNVKMVSIGELDRRYQRSLRDRKHYSYTRVPPLQKLDAEEITFQIISKVAVAISSNMQKLRLVIRHLALLFALTNLRAHRIRRDY